MSIDLQKKGGGINLKKGSRFSLKKRDVVLNHVQIGLCWGAEKGKGFLGRLFGKGIDLDGSVALYAADKRLLDLIYFGKLRSDDGAIRHSGDDLKGHTFTSDRDNEVIDIALDRLSPEVQTLMFYINSYRGDTFERLSFSRIRILEKTPDGSKPLASFFLEKEERFAGFTTMVMAKLFRSVDGAWEFEAIGEPLKDQKNSEIVLSLRNFI
ncbi:TerD family protein [Thermonema rossianum]|uniref:TerD family protein n=1 Tax=Thermonema rossianum TaxID=55505 RepID=UPI00056EA370|nr:TerD family protein [Thermonema rossianum]